MVISFNKQFKQPILDGSKDLTIREDKHDRWKPGMRMHMATGVRTSNYECFMEANVERTQPIRISWDGVYPTVYVSDKPIYSWDGDRENPIGEETMLRLAQHDGFPTISEFFKWHKADFTGKIIHWGEERF